MAKAVPLRRDTLSLFSAPLEQIHPDSQRRFGTLDPAGMLRHLSRSIEVSLEEVDGVTDTSNFVTRLPLMRWMAFEVMPIPRGKIKAPDYFTPAADGDVQAERERLFEAMERFLSALDKDPARITLNPIFGLMPLTYWSKIHGRHTQHHLAQFGVTLTAP
ncbi:MAG: DUF1569 domain-containing protein [Sumerlaeia bacterium]